MKDLLVLDSNIVQSEETSEVRIPSAPPGSPNKQRWFPDLRKSTPFQWLGRTQCGLQSGFSSFTPVQRLETPATVNQI
jgi:hypothetical protein